MKITIEPSEPHGFWGQDLPTVCIDTRNNKVKAHAALEAAFAALIAYGYSFELLMLAAGELTEGYKPAPKYDNADDE